MGFGIGVVEWSESVSGIFRFRLRIENAATNSIVFASIDSFRDGRIEQNQVDWGPGEMCRDDGLVNHI